MKRIYIELSINIIFLLKGIDASAWNRPGHMVSATTSYHVLKSENPSVIP